MTKFSAPFYAVPPGEIYPVEYAIGDECPVELETSANAVGALEKKTDQESSAELPSDEPAEAPAPAAKGKGK